MNDPKPSVGAIWKKVSGNGNEFLSIKVGDVSYVAFLNRKKQNENQPDFLIFESTKQSNNSKPQQKQQPAEKKPVAQKQQTPQQQVDF